MLECQDNAKAMGLFHCFYCSFLGLSAPSRKPKPIAALNHCFSNIKKYGGP